MTSYSKFPKLPSKNQINASLSIKEAGKTISAKRPIPQEIFEEKSSPKKSKTDSIDTSHYNSQIEKIPNNPTIDDVLSAIFPKDIKTTELIKSEAMDYFAHGFPYIIGERDIGENKFVYNKAEEMAKPYMQMRAKESQKNTELFPLKTETNVFENDRFFLFAGEHDPVISLGKARDIEGKGLGITDLTSIFFFSQFDEFSDHQLISIARLTFSFLPEARIINDTKGVDFSKFSKDIPEKEKRLSDLMASAACDDGSVLFSLLLKKGVDPFKKSLYFSKTPAEMAARDEAKKNLFLIEQLERQ